VATLKTRPARITYIDPQHRQDSAGGLVRNALLIEDDDDAKARLQADDEIPMEAFVSARDQFEDADAARLAFVEALVGNFDWCLKFSLDDTYRCDQHKPLWNLLALRRGNGAFPLMKDFDLSGIVTGEHPWFKDVYNPAFADSWIDVEVLGQVQRTRSLFPRNVLDAARRELLEKRGAVEQAIADAVVDAQGRESARAYTRSFYEAIGSDAAFYRPVVVRSDTRLYTDPSRANEACGPGEAIPLGTPVKELRRADAMANVILLDSMWRWGPRGCDAVHRGSVWIESAAMSSDYPPSTADAQRKK
jgi:hypothetical protein